MKMQCFGESEVELIINKGRAFIFEDVLVTNFLSPQSNFPSCTWKCISTIFFKTGICFYVFFFFMPQLSIRQVVIFTSTLNRACQLASEACTILLQVPKSAKEFPLEHCRASQRSPKEEFQTADRTRGTTTANTMDHHTRQRNGRCNESAPPPKVSRRKTAKGSAW